MIGKFFAHLDTKVMVTNLLITAATVIVSVLALVYTTRLAGPLPISIAQTTTQQQSTFTATGRTELSAIPDEGKVVVGITLQRPSVAAAQSTANETINSVSQSLKDLGIKDTDIRTTNYSIYPQYDYQPDQPQRIVGYSISTNLQITVKDLTKMNDVVDTATQAGANQVSSIEFTLSDELRDSLVKQARKEAIEDAKNNANELAQLSGLKLGKIINLTESEPNLPQPTISYREEAFESLAKADSTNLEPGSSNFNYVVVLSYQIL